MLECDDAERRQLTAAVDANETIGLFHMAIGGSVFQLVVRGASEWVLRVYDDIRVLALLFSTRSTVLIPDTTLSRVP